MEEYKISYKIARTNHESLKILLMPLQFSWPSYMFNMGFEKKCSQVGFICIYLHLYRFKTIERFQIPKVYFAFKTKQPNEHFMDFFLVLFVRLLA